MSEVLLELAAVTKQYRRGGPLFRRRVSAVDHVSFRIATEPSTIFAIIGESGSGKSTLARMILNIAQPTHGEVRFRGHDVARMRSAAERLAFMRAVQPIFQNPFEAFNPLKRLDHYLFSTARRLGGAAGRREIEERSDEALHSVG